MDFSKILDVLLITVGAVLGSFGQGLIAPRLPFGSWLVALIGIGVAIYSTRIDGASVNSFVMGVGIGLLLPAVTNIVGIATSAVKK